MYKTCQNEHSSCLCYHTCSHVRAPVLSLDTKDVCDQMTMASPDQQAEHAAQQAKPWQLSVETRGSRLVHVLWTMRAPVCLWSVVTHRWIGTGAVRTLWKSQSSVTDKAIMALLCAFKAIIKCDWVCPDATPTERWWGVYRQQIMIGEADGGNTHRIIAFSFQQRKKKSGNRLPSYTKQIMLLSAGEIWQLSVIHDAYWHRNVYIPRARGKMFPCWKSDAGYRPVQRQ